MPRRPSPPSGPARREQRPCARAMNRARATRFRVFVVVDARHRRFRPGFGARCQGLRLACASAASHAPISTSRNPPPGGRATSFTASSCEHEVDQQPVKSFQADRPKLKHARNHVGSEERIVERQHREHAVRRARGQVQRGRENRRARAFRAHQRPRQVEAVFRQQFVEVVAGDAPRNARKLLRGSGRIAVAEAASRE
jgi:hypothetical protein